MAKDNEKKPSTIGLTNDEMNASRAAWVNGEYTLGQGFSEWLANYRQATIAEQQIEAAQANKLFALEQLRQQKQQSKIAEQQIEAAQKQIEAADKLFALEQLRQQKPEFQPAPVAQSSLTWITAELGRMSVAKEIPAGARIGSVADELANRMVAAKRRGEVRAAIVSKSIENLLRYNQLWPLSKPAA